MAITRSRIEELLGKGYSILTAAKVAAKFIRGGSVGCSGDTIYGVVRGCAGSCSAALSRCM